jgi:hypothetical protein
MIPGMGLGSPLMKTKNRSQQTLKSVVSTSWMRERLHFSNKKLFLSFLSNSNSTTDVMRAGLSLYKGLYPGELDQQDLVCLPP